MLRNKTAKNEQKKIAFFFYETRDLNTYPSITNAARLLISANYQVDIYLPSAMETDLKLPGSNIEIVSEQEPVYYILNSVKYIRENQIHYDFLFAFSLEGLIISYKLQKYWAEIIPTSYFSMELIYTDYLSDLCRQTMKMVDLFSIKKLLFFSYYYLMLQVSGKKFIKFSIIQDSSRGQVLKGEFRFVNNIICLPNSYIGFSDTCSDFAYNRFDIPRGKKIIVFAGGISKSFGLNLFDMAKNLSSEYVLFVNAYSRDGYLDEVIHNFRREIDEGKLIFNKTNLSEDEYCELVKSAYIGLAWHPKVNPDALNMYYMGLSSGKLTKFLSCGKPIIAPAYFFGYPEMIDGKGIGRTCENAEEIPALLKAIEKAYKVMQQNIKEFYLENVEYEKKFEPVLAEMSKYVES